MKLLMWFVLIILLYQPLQAEVTGVDDIPIGGMFATFPHMTGSFQPPASGQVKDGFMRADGATVTDIKSPMYGHVLPNMTGNTYLRGDAASTNTVAGSNSNTLSSGQMASHTQSIDHDHASKATGNPSANHTHSVNLAGATSGNPSGTTTGYFELTDNNTTSMSVRVSYVFGQAAASAASRSFYWDGGGSTQNGSYSVNADLNAHSHRVPLDYNSDNQPSNTNHSHQYDLPNLAVTSGANGSGDSYDNRPKSVTVVYLIKVK